MKPYETLYNHPPSLYQGGQVPLLIRGNRVSSSLYDEHSRGLQTPAGRKLMEAQKWPSRVLRGSRRVSNGWWRGPVKEETAFTHTGKRPVASLPRRNQSYWQAQDNFATSKEPV